MRNFILFLFTFTIFFQSNAAVTRSFDEDSIAIACAKHYDRLLAEEKEAREAYETERDQWLDSQTEIDALLYRTFASALSTHSIQLQRVAELVDEFEYATNEFVKEAIREDFYEAVFELAITLRRFFEDEIPGTTTTDEGWLRVTTDEETVDFFPIFYAFENQYNSDPTGRAFIALVIRENETDLASWRLDQNYLVAGSRNLAVNSTVYKTFEDSYYALANRQKDAEFMTYVERGQELLSEDESEELP